MSNDFLPSVSQVGASTRGRSSEINSHRNEVLAAFEKMPSRQAWFDGNLNLATSVALSTNTYTMSFANMPAGFTVAYREGLTVRFVASANNPSGGTNINLNGLGARALKKADGSALAANDLLSGQVVVAVFNSGSNEFRVTTFLGSELADAAAAAAAASTSETNAAASASAAATSASNASTSETNAAASAASAAAAIDVILTSAETNDGTSSQYDVDRTGVAPDNPIDGQKLSIEIHDSKIAALNLAIRFSNGATKGSYFTVYDRSKGNNNIHITDENGNTHLGVVGAVLDLEFSTSAQGWIVRGYRVSPQSGLTVDASADAFISMKLSTTHDMEEFILSNVIPATDNSFLYARLSNDDGASFLATGYNWADDANFGAAVSAVSLTGILGVGNDAGGGVSGLIRVHRPRDAGSKTRITGNLAFTLPDGTVRQRSLGAEHSNAEAHQAIQFIFSSGDISSGRIQRVDN